MPVSNRTYMDHAATSFPKPREVIDAMVRYQTELGASPGRGAYAEAHESAAGMQTCRERINTLLNGESPDHVVFTLNTSDALNLAIRGLVRPGDHVVTTWLDHNSVLRPLNELEQRGEITQTRVRCDPKTGLVDPEDIQATGHVTVAEHPVDWEELKSQLPPGTPKPPPEMLQPGALVFQPTREPVPLNQPGRWWNWTDQASWRHPEGPGSDLEGRGNHPVVQVAWDDAMAYASWAGKQLPTEVQWERAARGETDTRYTWGDELKTDAVNTWTGRFPDKNTEEDGFFRTAPVKSYPPNDLGVYETAGNVWEWCRDLYRDDRNANLAKVESPLDPPPPEEASDAANPGVPTRVIKGGSYLCHVDYCESYRPSARRGTTADTGLSHTGFRCVIEPAAGAKVKSEK